MKCLPWVLLFSAGVNMRMAHATATSTQTAGGGQPMDLAQPALALPHLVATRGLFPARGGGGGGAGDTLATLHLFAGTFAPYGEPMAAGQLLPISQNTALFSVLGTTYGGDGQTTFALPNLGETLLLGSGQDATGLPHDVGARLGMPFTTFLLSQLPPHAHTLPGGGSLTSLVGGGQAVDLHKPSLAVTYMVATVGIFPSAGGGSAVFPFLGQVRAFCGTFVPDGWLPADGRLLTIADNSALYAVLGTTFGGDATTTFALPDLRGRVPVGTGAAPGLAPVALGEVLGSPQMTLQAGQMPQHLHGLTGGGTTGVAGGSIPFSNSQPGLGMTFLVATQGLFPARDSGAFDASTPTLGEVVTFAGNFAPGGFVLAAGQLLAINQNAALFSLLGTTFGGSGVTTFGIPDLRGRTPVGTSPNLPVGTQYGNTNITLLHTQMPAHVHTYELPAVSSSLASSSVSSASSVASLAEGSSAAPQGASSVAASGVSSASVGGMTGGSSAFAGSSRSGTVSAASSARSSASATGSSVAHASSSTGTVASTSTGARSASLMGSTSVSVSQDVSSSQPAADQGGPRGCVCAAAVGRRFGVRAVLLMLGLFLVRPRNKSKR